MFCQNTVWSSGEFKATPSNVLNCTLFTVETVSCLGACGLAPTLTVNDEVHPKMTPEKAVELLNELRGECV